MTPSEHLIAILNELNLPKEGIIIGGSGVLALRDIRHVRDVDIFAKRKLWNDLEASGDWVRWDPDPNDPIRHDDPPYLIRIVNGVECHVFYDWKHRGYLIDVPWHLDNPEWVKGWPTVALNFLMQWKEVTQRPKDIEDIKLINKYLVAGGV